MECQHNRMFWLIYPGNVCDKCKSLWSYKQFTMEPQNLAQPDAYSLLANVRAILEDIVEGEYRIFHRDSMDQDTGLEEDIRNLYKKVSEHFS